MGWEIFKQSDKWLPLVQQYWQAAALIAAAAFLGGYGLAMYVYSERIKNLRSELENLHSKFELADYSAKLGGIAPGGGKGVLADFVSVNGVRWEPLSGAQHRKLRGAIVGLGNHPDPDLQKRLLLLKEGGRMQVIYINRLGKELAESIAEAFEDAGWPTSCGETNGPLPAGINTGRGGGVPIELARIMTEATDLEVGSIAPDDSQRDFVFVAVGIKAA
jgi:hypothetical protein